MASASNVVHLVPASRVTSDDDTVELLTALLAHARAGRLKGTVVAWSQNDGKFSAMTTGVYSSDHIAALGAASKLWSQINEATSE